MAKKSYKAVNGNLVEIDPVTRQPLDGQSVHSAGNLANRKAQDDLGEAFGINSPRQFTKEQRTAIAQTKAAFEPAVLSSDNIDTYIADSKAKLGTMSQKGAVVGQDGNMYGAHGAMLSAPADDSQYDEGTGSYNYGGKNYGAAEFYDSDPDWKAVQKLFAPLYASLDESTSGQVSAIHQQFESLREQQRAYNEQAEKGRSRINLLGGSSRYAPLAASSNMLSQTSYGLRQIADLDAKENMAIAQAKAAQAEGNARLMTQAISMAEGIRKEKQTAAAKVMESLQKANDEMRKGMIQSSRDEAVAGLMAQGVTDPKQMLELLNKYDDGSSTGGNFTAEEIKKAISNLTPTGGGLYKFTNDDVGKMFAAGMNATQIQQTQDYYNGKGAAPELTGAQQAAVQKALGGAGTGSGGSFKLTQGQTSQLLSGGFTLSDAQAMTADIATHGIESVLEGLDADKQKLVKRVFGTNEDIGGNLSDEEDKTEFLSADYFETLFGEDALKKAADEAGYRHVLSAWGTEKQNYLDSLMNTVEQYRKAGYTDKEILKMMQ